MESIFNFQDYKAYLTARLRVGGKRGSHSLVATAIGCRPSFLSKVLYRKTHLTPEHAVALARYWKLSPREAEYFRELVQLGRAGTSELRGVIQCRLHSLKITSDGDRVP
jgi:hypothetical protein